MYHWRKGIARWRVGNTLYLSVPFTWLLDEAEQEKKAKENKYKVLIGGPALMRPNECDGFEPILSHNPQATFTTRGCVNSCGFCAVPKLEGDLVEIPNFRPAPVICDNNLLAASKAHIRRVVDKLKVFSYVDFNQGLEARRFTSEIADWFSELRCKVRFAIDSQGQIGVGSDAIELCRERTTNDIGIYCLIGYKDSPEEARSRLELVRSWGIRPTPMRYQPLDAKVKDQYVAPGWTDYELKKMMHYYSRLRWYEHIPYEDFQYSEEPLELQARMI